MMDTKTYHLTDNQVRIICAALWYFEADTTSSEDNATCIRLLNFLEGKLASATITTEPVVATPKFHYAGLDYSKK